MTVVRTAVAVAGVVAVTLAGAWLLAQPLLSPSAAAVRAVADGAAVTALGLATVQMLDGHRFRDELMARASTPLVAAGAIWLIAELVRLTLGAAEAADVAVGQLSAQTTWDFATLTSAGRSGVLSLLAAAAIAATAMLLRPSPAVRLAAAGAAATGLAARAVTGHLAEGTLSATAVVVHALAAAVWCGVLTALALTVRSRGQWARVLPTFSQLSLLCVSVLVVGGTVSALTRIGTLSELVTTGYGRILVAKLIATAVLVALAARYRATWVPSATSHRISAQASRRKSLIELAVMAVALTLAAALTVTG
ncbi:CopD family protein [Mycobacterium sp. MS1601]|uniref:CopD family protein n=1 Tax=Mycobacterium sp. MS1601 TaxID=1936029 RepID=UPI001F012BFC|nr:CopD family protein [Mycobacterium sp. MS1601]